jgi:hypothetical protein
MVSRVRLMSEISDKISPEHPFSDSEVRLPTEDLECILWWVDNYNPDPSKIAVGVRPTRQKRPPECRSRYKERLCGYISQNTRLFITPSSVTNARFYDAVADYLIQRKGVREQKVGCRLQKSEYEMSTPPQAP